MFPSMILTKLGEKLLNKAIAEKKVLKFTKIKIGSGEAQGNKEDLIDLVSPFKIVPILSTEIQEDHIVKIKGYFDNKDTERDIEWKEIGVYCQIGDDSITEILYSYSNSSPEKVIIPNKNRGDFERTLDIRNYIGSATKITFNITEVSDAYQFNTKEEMKVATYLKIGDKVGLWGENELGNKELRLYIIKNSSSSPEAIKLENSLYANKYLDTSEYLIKGDIPKNFDSAEKIVAALTGATGIKFDENIRYLNDSGEKKIGYCYLDRLTPGLFECIRTTSKTINDSSYFKNYSTKINSDRLDNLVYLKQSEISNYKSGYWYNIEYPDGFNHENCIVLMQDIGAGSDSANIFKINFEKTKFSVIKMTTKQINVTITFLFIKTKHL